MRVGGRQEEQRSEIADVRSSQKTLIESPPRAVVQLSEETVMLKKV